jgi:outer membrane protein OmpA-like peptidoglycan-associated protein
MLLLLLPAGQAVAADGPELQIKALKPGALVTVDRLVGDGKVLLSVADAEKQPLLGLGDLDFAVSQGGRTARIVSVQPIAESLEVPRHIVLVLDNSDSMRQRNAVEPLLAGVDELLKIVRPIDQVQIVVFDSQQTIKMRSGELHVRTFKSNNPVELKSFVAAVYRDGMTPSTVLYEGMLAGLEIIRMLPADSPKFMVVFSDGEDLNSVFKREDVVKAAQGLARFDAYAIDYMPGATTDKFLSEFAGQNSGQVWKATSETNLVPIFQSVASKMQYYYVVNYLFPTTGNLLVSPDSLTIEEIKTIDASPLLAHVYFDEGASDIPSRYVRLAGAEEAAAFDEQRFRDTLEKYYQVLNIVGKRLVDHPQATITLVGCNANTGKEKGNKQLSAQRAEAVRLYLQTNWGIAPDRISTEVRNLPEKPSTSRLAEGQADNRRVEIRSDAPAILDLIRSTYFATRIDASALTLRPSIDSAYGIARWKLAVTNAAATLAAIGGDGGPVAEMTVPVPTANLNELAAGGDLAVNMVLHDRRGQELVLNAGPVKVNFLQTSKRLAQKEGLKVQEKYALILFDFDSDTIDARNQAIVDAIADRIRNLPQATVEIVGHTDNIGKDAYNIKLSERRALAVYKLLAAAYGEDPAGRIHHAGVGPNDPLYENTSSETRSFNRTVTITLDYLSAE